MAIDRKKIIETMSQLKIEGNEQGLIPAFGVMVNQLPAALWNNFAELVTHSVSSELLEAAQFLLQNAAHECGYHTGYGIITSEEWKAVVAPMVEKAPEDILHGAFAILTAWGWAKAEIVALEPGRQMVVRAYDYYEVDVIDHGRAPTMISYLLQGICSAFMELAYGGPYPTGLNTFHCEQVKGIERGDDYGEFVVTPAR